MDNIRAGEQFVVIYEDSLGYHVAREVHVKDERVFGVYDDSRDAIRAASELNTLDMEYDDIFLQGLGGTL